MKLLEVRDWYVPLIGANSFLVYQVPHTREFEATRVESFGRKQQAAGRFE